MVVVAVVVSLLLSRWMLERTRMDSRDSWPVRARSRNPGGRLWMKVLNVGEKGREG